jgi:hypothetical protein
MAERLRGRIKGRKIERKDVRRVLKKGNEGGRRDSEKKRQND